MRVRLELEALREDGVVRLEKSGVHLTPRAITRIVPRLAAVKCQRVLPLQDLGLAGLLIGVHLVAEPLAPTWQYRDLAVRRGGTGLVLLRHHHGAWRFSHDLEPLEGWSPRDAGVISSGFSDPSEGDHVAIAAGPNRGVAGLALWAVVTEILALGI